MVRHLSRDRGLATLAVDADPNATLGVALGVECETAIADIREDVLEKRIELSPGMSKERQIEYMIHDSVVESQGFDLITMGRPEGAKCYCYVNNLLRKYLDQATSDYPCIVIDNEAGMEHLSRRTTNDVDLLVIVAEPTVVGVLSAHRIWQLSEELPILVRRRSFILNRIGEGGVADSLRQRMTDLRLTPDIEIGQDREIFDAAAEGVSLFDLPDSNDTFREIRAYLDGAVPQL